MKQAVENTTIREKLMNCTYLEDECTTVYGIKIYGTPWFVCYSLNWTAI